ncbi:MAG: F0F1 ATP synthase subunit B [Eubacteriales bacterium]|nr:F0F1 ATP synthase subunit B [Eubacteriales bacterium]MDD4390368.1 F0F1 ATP synthase subunit B [Eubacteriales bacterium]
MAEALGFNVYEIIFAIANFLILMAILTKLFYKPFLELLDNRQKAIKDSFANAEAVNRRADEKLDAYNKRIANVEQEGREIIAKSKHRADEQAKRIAEDAEEKAASLLKNARNEIEREKVSALAEVREQISMLALLAAEKILEKEISKDPEGHGKIIDNVLEQVGTTGWQN